ncbi:MAG: MATE family efflux transporter [Treponemataceae bacterium]|nr:MATE family efflux transporter [Treponemataceae bacterium]
MEQNPATAPTLGEKEARRRQMILYGAPVRTILTLALPLVFYNSLHQIFQLLDTLIAANMGAGVVSTVSFVAQIETMLYAIGSGLSVGGSIIISRSYGAGDMAAVRSHISTLFFACLAVGALILSLAVPFARPFLRLLRMPDDLLGEGTLYFMLAVTGIIFQFINTIYLATEKSRGNTKTIMWCNMLVMVTKTALNAAVILLLKGGAISPRTAMLLLPAATITAQLSLTVIALATLTSRKNPFRLSLRACAFRKAFLVPLANLSIPVFLEKFIFAFGKVIVNSMCAAMGSTVVGALGVSNRLGGFSTNPPAGFQEAESSLISQNLGNRNLARALGIFYRTLVINLIIAAAFFSVMMLCKDRIILLFARGDAAFAAEINAIYPYECCDSVLVSLNASVMGLLYGFGRTRVSMILNVVRLFVYRIPPLFLLMRFTTIGIPAVGIAMLISNGAVGITSLIVAVIFIRRLKTGTARIDL